MTDVEVRSGLVGRQRELKELLDRGGRVASVGAGAIAWVCGEAGIGKTRLLEVVGEHHRSGGGAVLTARARELEGRWPFAAALQLLDEPARATLTPSAGIGAPGSGEDQFRVLESLLETIERAARDQPLLLALDDLQWADAMTLMFLDRLSRELERLPVLIVAALRPLPRRPELAGLLADGDRRGDLVFDLGPLSESDSLKLAAELVGGRPGTRLSERVARCGGNPLFILTALATLDEEHASSDHGAAEPAGDTLPVEVGAAILGRLRFLSPSCGNLLHIASALGTRFGVSELAAVMSSATVDLLPLVQEALDARLLRSEGDRLEFVHDVVREALYGDMPGPVRVALHRELWHVLEAGGAPPQRVAEHVVRGAMLGDSDAVAWLKRAAEAAAPRGAGVAAELQAEALALCDATDPDRAELSASLAINLAVAGRHEQAQELCRQLLEDRPNTPVADRLRLCLAESLLDQGRVGEALENARAVGSSAAASAAERARALWLQSTVAMWGRERERAAESAHRALELAEEADDGPGRVRILVVLGHLAGMAGDFATQKQLCQIGADSARVLDTPAAHSTQSVCSYAMALADSDEIDAAERAISSARRTYARLGLDQSMASSCHYAGYAQSFGTNWDDALAELETTTTGGEELGTGWHIDSLARQAHLLARRAEPEQATARLDLADAHRAHGAPEWRPGWLDWGRALVAEARGRPDDATRAMWRAWTQATATGLPSQQRELAPELARMLARRGERERGAAVATAIDALAAANPGLTSLEALSIRCHALVDGDVDRLAAAAEMLRGTQRVHERALACEDAAVALAAAGRTAEASGLAEEAEAVYAGLAAAHDGARLRARLREAGLPLGRRGPRGRPQHGWASLTPSELAVAELAIEGLTNREIADRLVLSRHTVVTHMSNALRKLELRSRAQLGTSRAAQA